MSGSQARAGLPEWLTEFDAFAQQTLEQAAVPGAAVAITQHGKTIYRRGFGWRDREARLPAGPATVFGLASLSKSFTALTALVLQAQGLLSLEDRVADLLPGFDYPGLGLATNGHTAGQAAGHDVGHQDAHQGVQHDVRHDVRLWQMLSHTTGVPPLRALEFALDGNQAGDPAFVYNKSEPRGPESVDDYDQLLAYMRRGEREAFAEPGRFVSYSNECVALVGAIIERVTGRAFPDVVRELVLEPLGMHSAGYDTVAAKATGNVTTLYTHDPAGAAIRSPVWNEAPAYLGTGFLKASVDDLAGYLSFLAAGDGSALGIPNELLAELTRPRAWAAPGAGYALGWTVRRQGDVTVVRHGGSLKGIATAQGFVPELGLGVVVLTNVDDAPAGRVWQGAVNLALGQPAARATYAGRGYRIVSGTSADAPELTSVAGLYSSGEPWGRLELRVDRVDAADAEAAQSGSSTSGGGWELRAYNGEDATPAGRFAWLSDQPPGQHEYLLITEENGEEVAWDGGRLHLGADGRFVAVQHSLRWYDRV